jgi:hypothetical protein
MPRRVAARVTCFAAVGFVLALAHFAGPVSLQAQGRTVWDGVFSAVQAERGRVAYDTYCAPCHGFDLSGVNRQRELAGDLFRGNWDAATVNDLFTKVSTTMPQTSPGALPGDVYADIISHIFASNGFPAGDGELTTESAVMAGILIVGMDGPLPADTGSLVRAVGCFARDGAGGWSLERTTGVLRTREMNASEGAGLVTAETTPLGIQNIPLLGYIPPVMEAQLGRRVEAKGLLIVSADEVRIRITSIQMISETCN